MNATDSAELSVKTAGMAIVISSAAIVTADLRAAVTGTPRFKKTRGIKPSAGAVQTGYEERNPRIPADARRVEMPALI
jgi:hypothetical protein